jgi:hypothetical protein
MKLGRQLAMHNLAVAFNRYIESHPANACPCHDQFCEWSLEVAEKNHGSILSQYWPQMERIAAPGQNDPSTPSHGLCRAKAIL